MTESYGFYSQIFFIEKKTNKINVLNFVLKKSALVVDKRKRFIHKK